MPAYQNKKTKLWYWKETFDGKIIKKENKKWTRKKYAEEHLESFKKDYEHGKILLNDPLFEEVIQKYYRLIKIKYRQSTYRRVTESIKQYLIPRFSGLRISQINELEIQRFQEYLLSLRTNQGEPYKNSYLKRIQKYLAQIMDYSLRNGWIRVDPFVNIAIAQQSHPEKKEEITILTYDEYESFIKTVDNIFHKIYFSTCYWTGMRPGELMALAMEDIDLVNKTIDIYKNYDTKNNVITTTKNRKTRKIKIADQHIKDFEELFETIGTSNIDGKMPLVGITHRLSKTTIDRIRKEYIKQSDSKYFTYKDLRHTHVSQLIELGWDPIDIAKRLGHTVEMVNNTYGHLFDKRQQDKMNLLNNLGKDDKNGTDFVH